MQRVTQWLLAGVLGSVAALACGDGFGIEDVLGTWNTLSINGHSVPGTVEYQDNTYNAEYVRWAFLGAGQCSLTQQVDGDTDSSNECEYTIDLEEKTLTISFPGETWEGTVDGNGMTLTDPQGLVWELRRQ